MIIDSLPALSSPVSTDEMPIERGTATYKVTLNELGAVVKSEASEGTDRTLVVTGDKYRWNRKVNRDGSDLTNPTSWLNSLGIKWTKVTGTTSAGGTIGLGLAKNRYMVFGVWSSVSSGNSHIVTPLITAGGTNWSALVETVTHSAVANTAVTLYVGYIDFGAGNIS